MKHNAIFYFVIGCFIGGNAFSQSPVIIGGQEADEEEYTWMVQLLSENTLHCGATLIAENWILTAGHCAVDVPAFGIEKPDKVIINSIYKDSLATYSTEVNILEYYVHPNFDINNTNYANDIALLKLESPITSILPVEINLNNNQLIELQDDVLVLGWGSTNISGTGSDLLKEAIPKVKSLNSTHISAGYDSSESPAGAGAGDSGGPLLFNDNGEFIQVGIVSGGEGIVTQAGQPGIFTRIYAFTDWIASIINEPVSVTNFEESQFNAWFTENQLHVKNKNTDQLNFSLIDINGRAIINGVLTEENTVISLPYLESGVYFLKIHKNHTLNQKLIKL